MKRAAWRRLLTLLLGAVWLAGAGVARAQSDCPGDLNDDLVVTIDELVRAVGSAVNGCEPGPPPAQSMLLRTGQSECDQGSGTFGPCPGSPPGQDGAVQAGLPRIYTDNADGTIADNTTGLVWEKLSDDDSIHDWDTPYTWYDAFTVKIAALNSPPCFAGHCDWRLPNRNEIESLVDLGRSAPAVDPIFSTGCEPGCTVLTCSCTQLENYWSSTTFHGSADFAWAVNFDPGNVEAFEKTLEFPYVRAVRGGR